MFCEDVSTTNEVVSDWRSKILSFFIPKINSKIGKNFGQKCTKDKPLLLVVAISAISFRIMKLTSI